MSRSVFVVEDHHTLRQSICELLGNQPGLRVAGSAASGEEALDELAGRRVDLVLVDMALPGMSGTRVIETLAQSSPDTLCAVLSGHDDAHYVEQALAAGARGYLLKGMPYEIAPAVHKILGGEVYVSKPLR